MAVKKREAESGQAVVEYILITSMMVIFIVILTQMLARIGLGKKLSNPVQTTFAMAYKYGDPRAKGFAEGGPRFHPKALPGENNGRMFVSPRTN